MADILLVDANNIAARCWQARAFNASEEPPPGEIAATALGMIDKQVRGMHLDARHVFVVFDGGDSHRTSAFPGYKADRAARPDGLERTLDILDERAYRQGYQGLVREGWEADDTIATLARKHLRLGHGVCIYSSDRDLLQLLDERVLVVQPLAKGEFREWTRASFEAEYGFAPRLLPDFKALTGDKSDCLPGVDKLGVVWGKRLIAAHGGIDTLYAALRVMPEDSLSVLQKNILAAEDQVRLNGILSTLQEVPGV